VFCIDIAFNRFFPSVPYEFAGIIVDTFQECLVLSNTPIQYSTGFLEAYYRNPQFSRLKAVALVLVDRFDNHNKCAILNAVQLQVLSRSCYKDYNLPFNIPILTYRHIITAEDALNHKREIPYQLLENIVIDFLYGDYNLPSNETASTRTLVEMAIKASVKGLMLKHRKKAKQVIHRVASRYLPPELGTQLDNYYSTLHDRFKSLGTQLQQQ